MKLTDLKVGDKITVVKNRGSYRAVRTVAKVLKTKVVDSSGDEWTINGNEYGAGRDSWVYSSAVPWEPKHDDEVRAAQEEARQKNLRHFVRYYNYSDATLELIEELVAVIKKHAGAKP